jgi:hypothetical protein
MIEGCETDYGFVRYSPAVVAYLDKFASRRHERKGRMGRERIAHLKLSERVANACCLCASIHWAATGNVLESF